MRLREIGYENLIVGLTGASFDDEIEEFLMHGADVVFSKPFTIHSMSALIDHADACGFHSQQDVKYQVNFDKLVVKKWTPRKSILRTSFSTDSIFNLPIRLSQTSGVESEFSFVTQHHLTSSEEANTNSLRNALNSYDDNSRTDVEHQKAQVLNNLYLSDNDSAEKPVLSNEKSLYSSNLHSRLGSPIILNDYQNFKPTSRNAEDYQIDIGLLPSNSM
jgi:hypothetical protein